MDCARIKNLEFRGRTNTVLLEIRKIVAYYSSEIPHTNNWLRFYRTMERACMLYTILATY